jgi:hypothetical protein
VAWNLRSALIAWPDDRRPSLAPPGDQCRHDLKPYQRLVAQKDERGILLVVSLGFERGETEAYRVGEAQPRRMIDNGVETQAVRKAQSLIIVRSNHHVPAVEQATFECGHSDIEHVSQQWPAAVQGMELPAPEPPPLAGREDERVGPQRPFACEGRAYWARSRAVVSARLVITVAR